MTVFVNDEPKELTEDASLGELTKLLGLAETKGRAFALNNVIIPKIKLDQTRLNEGDHILIIQATQGG